MYTNDCRFEETFQSLMACFRTVYEHDRGMAKRPVSEREIAWFRRMVFDIFCWIHDTDLITEDGEVDDEVLAAMCEALAKGEEERA